MALLPWKYKIIDISKWSEVKTGFFRYLYEDLGINMVILRIGNGSVIDPTFHYRYAQSKLEAPDLKIGGYYVPNEIYSIATNFNYCQTFIGERKMDLVAADVETAIGGGTWSMVRNIGVGVYLKIKEVYGDVKSYFYSGLNPLKLMGNFSLWSQVKRTWIAGYFGSIPSKYWWPSPLKLYWNELPYGLIYYMWQFYPSWTVDSTYSRSGLDANVGYSEMIDTFADEPTPEPPPVENLALGYFECLVGSLRVRSGPGTNFPTVSYLYQNQQGYFVDEVEKSINEKWIKIAPDRWSAATYNGSILAKTTYFPTPTIYDIRDSGWELEPDELPEEEKLIWDVKVTSEKAVLWAVTDIRDDNVLIIETNAYLATGNKNFKFESGDKLKVHAGAIQADGDNKFFRFYGLTYPHYDQLYIRKDQVIRIFE